ncbi:MAG: ribonuclease HI [Chlorobiaceae bacterium]|nr:ribonuclease HI [Chlorobiaceae bacterium]NTV25021.1 ribonuclease HI [Chlorobiaceae bacterium]
MEKKIIIYTDGACSGNPGRGGWGALLMYGTTKKELSGYDPATTNNRMELMAAIRGLDALKEPCHVDLYSDSAYLVNAINQNWLTRWVKNGWKTAAKKPVENIDLWQDILKLIRLHRVTFHKVKGHSDNPYNNRCDELARMAIKDNS